MRVEADGSVVVAGKAPSEALVELLNGATVLASTKAGIEGDFAIILDDPLKPGDYQITLRATPPDGTAIASLQTAVLSIPDTPGGQVLAMIEQPGEASELVTVPQPEAPPAEPKVDEAAAPPADATAPKVDEAAAPPADAAAPKTDEAAAPPAEAAPQPPEVAAVTPPKAEEPAPAPSPAPAEVKVVVEAVEIEGSKIFVAGTSEPGRTIRAYANEIVLGETRVSEGGRFLIEAEHELPVGNYLIRADVLDADGVKVIARAAVPFEREPGEIDCRRCAARRCCRRTAGNRRGRRAGAAGRGNCSGRAGGAAARGTCGGRSRTCCAGDRTGASLPRRRLRLPQLNRPLPSPPRRQSNRRRHRERRPRSRSRAACGRARCSGGRTGAGQRGATGGRSCRAAGCRRRGGGGAAARGHGAEAAEGTWRRHYPPRRFAVAHFAPRLRSWRSLFDDLSGQPGADPGSRPHLAGPGFPHARKDQGRRGGRHDCDR